MKRVVIIQSNYIPWKGYFDMINLADEVVLYDDVQYTKNDWRNRNRIKTTQGVQWITIPVFHSISQRINEIKVSDSRWNKNHWKTLVTNYSKAPFFNETKSYFEDLYLSRSETMLSEINLIFIKAINDYLGIATKIRRSSEFNLQGNSTERLVYICKQTNASVYLTGPAAKNYLDEKLFDEENIMIEWMNYGDYPEHPQLNPPFEHAVTVLDLIFNTGSSNKKYLKSFR